LKPKKFPEKGYFDEFGFYHCYQGGFYDTKGRRFNNEGFDEEGGYYDEKWVYIPPPAKKPTPLQPK